jgi:hypothetical protein
MYNICILCLSFDNRTKRLSLEGGTKRGSNPLKTLGRGTKKELRVARSLNALPTRRVRFKETESTSRQNVLVIGSTAPAEVVAKHNSPSPRELEWLIPLLL